MQTLRTPDQNDALISQSLSLETAIRQLCIQHFPRQISNVRPHCSALVSITARMWNARRLFSKATPCTLQAMFQCWRHMSTYSVLHRRIRSLNPQNKCQRLDIFMKDSVDLALRHEILDWHRRIRQFCSKSKRQKIQLFDRFGAPLTPQQELDQITEFFGQLYCDPNFQSDNPPALTHVPFTEDQIRTQLQGLPMTKALAPDGLPALIWRHFAADL